MKKKKSIIIFTDGSCNVKDFQKRGGLGVYIKMGEKEIALRKGYSNTTISRMELRAILFALKSIKKDISTNVYLYSDSEYAVNMIRNNSFDWENKLIKQNYCNRDLLDLIFKEIKDHKLMRLKLIWVRGHQKNYEDEIVQGNFIADKLADYKTQEQWERDIEYGRETVE